jgi:hypothetical protein
LERSELKAVSRTIWILCLVLSASIADAKLVTEHLQDVSFTDGAKATGSLVLDTDENRIVDFDITTTSGSTFSSSFRYLPGTARITQEGNDPGEGWPFSFLQINAVFDDSSGGRQLFLAFSGPIDDVHPTSILQGIASGQISYELGYTGQQLRRERLISGLAVIQASPIPEPAQIVCLGVGLSLMWGRSAWVRRRLREKPLHNRRGSRMSSRGGSEQSRNC